MKKDNMETVSIIIPVYNQAKFLKRCVDSVIGQTYSALEILLIDDGSTDESPGICDRYAQTDERIKVLHQDNKGLSGARNTGIDHSTGELLMFCDSDDEMLPTMVETLIDTMHKTDADIAVCDFREIFPGDNIPEEMRTREYIKPSDEEITVSSGDEKLEMIWSRVVITVVQWNKLFRRRIFETYRYPEGRYHEDEWAVHHECYEADKVAVIERKLYLYYRHGESITWQPSLKKRIDAVEGFLDRAVFFKEKGRLMFALRAYRAFIIVFNETMANIDSFDDSEEMLPCMQEIAKREKYRIAIVNLMIKLRDFFRFQAQKKQ